MDVGQNTKAEEKLNQESNETPDNKSDGRQVINQMKGQISNRMKTQIINWGEKVDK